MSFALLRNTKVNMVWDGLFHAAVWIITLLGIALVWGAAQRRDVEFATRHLIGGFLIGWGLFNVVEGVIDHHLLGVHHVMERLGASGWDYAFLAWGTAMIILGWRVVRRRSP